jgi:hypothetical protein
MSGRKDMPTAEEENKMKKKTTKSTVYRQTISAINVVKSDMQCNGMRAHDGCDRSTGDAYSS